MKKEIKKYKSYELQAIEENLSPKNKRLLKDYLLFRATAGAKTKQNIKRDLIKCMDIFEVDMDKITPKQLLEFLNLITNCNLATETANSFKKHFKGFIDWKYTDPEISKILKQFKQKNGANHEKVNPETIVKENEVELLMRGTDSIKYKTLIILSWETAGRPQEILDLKWKDINFNENTITLRCAKKGGKMRVIPIQESIPHLERLREEWNFPDRTQEDFIFLGSKRETRLTNRSWEQEIEKLSLKVLNRKITPYLFRHGRLTMLQDEMTGKVYEDFADHSLQVASRYRHPSQGKLVDTMRKNMYKVKKLTPQEQDKIKELEKEILDLKKNWKASMELAKKAIKHYDELKNKVESISN